MLAAQDFYNPISIDVVDDYGLTKVLTASRADAVISNLTLALLNLAIDDLYVDWSISSVNIEDVKIGLKEVFDELKKAKFIEFI